MSKSRISGPQNLLTMVEMSLDRRDIHVFFLSREKGELRHEHP